MRRALISVTDKHGVVEFARGLMGAGLAYEYLTRRYVAGNDPRVAELLAEWEQAA